MKVSTTCNTVLFTLFLLVLNMGCSSSVFSQKAESSSQAALSKETQKQRLLRCYQLIQKSAYTEAMECLKENPQGESSLSAGQLLSGLLLVGLEEGTLNAANLKQVNVWLDAAAEKGNKKAQRYLAIAYTKGMDRPVNHQEALRWLKKAAEQGDAMAQFMLSDIFRKGESVPKDLNASFQWTMKAAENGHPQAQIRMGKLMAKQPGATSKEVFKWFNMAAEQGVKKAYTVVGIAYLTGDGVEQNPEKGLDYLQRAADEGIALAQFSLGSVYLMGQLVPEDCAKATGLLRKAGEQGHEDAMLVMGSLELYGEDGCGLFKTMAQSGSGTLELMEKMAEEQADNADFDSNAKASYGWYKKAAMRGNGDAKWILGAFYATGLGVEKDPVTAVMWASIALENKANHIDNGEPQLKQFKDSMGLMRSGLSDVQLAQAEEAKSACLQSGYENCRW